MKRKNNVFYNFLKDLSDAVYEQVVTGIQLILIGLGLAGIFNCYDGLLINNVYYMVLGTVISIIAVVLVFKLGQAIYYIKESDEK